MTGVELLVCVIEVWQDPMYVTWGIDSYVVR